MLKVLPILLGVLCLAYAEMTNKQTPDNNIKSEFITPGEPIMTKLNVEQAFTQELLKQNSSTILIGKKFNFNNETFHDPCLEAPCKFGEICEKSIDGISFNCIKETVAKRQLFSDSKNPVDETKDLFTNYPVEYYKHYFNFNPCLSSPCSSKQICRNIMIEKGYICVNELQAPNDIAVMRAYYNGLEQNFKPSIQRDVNVILKKIQTAAALPLSAKRKAAGPIGPYKPSEKYLRQFPRIRKLNAKMTKNACASSPCGNNTICVNTPNEKGYKCKEEEVKKSEEIQVIEENKQVEVKTDDKQVEVREEVKEGEETTLPSTTTTTTETTETIETKEDISSAVEEIEEVTEIEDTETTTETITTTTEHYETKMCVNKTADAKVAHPTDPEKFYLCLNENEFAILNCKDDLVFNSYLNTCWENKDQIMEICASSPCLYGGKCVSVSDDEYECKCPSGFSGANCEVVADACASNPCGDNGECHTVSKNKHLSYYCVCDENNYYGLNCDSGKHVNPCIDEEDDEQIFNTKLHSSIYIDCIGEYFEFLVCRRTKSGKCKFSPLVSDKKK